ncbi:hypothetical protein E4U43_008000 [Claviceps pusilla]|uniref:Dehydrogenase n=1 Tax=Claviceps pusilla TaxID=123648 RepID=A0A9P7NDT8_9HYPO|nr:hypothetical protein E4U43_008000 [Claviceps pusilla]
MDVSGFALITGAASGIGKACARAFIREGAAGVALVDISEQALQTTKAELEKEISGMANNKESPPRLATYVLDVRDETQVQHVVAEAAAWLGRLDYVVNAAGVASTTGGAAEATSEEWKRTLGINLDGTFYVLAAAARIMLAQEPLVSSLVNEDNNDGNDDGGVSSARCQRGSIINLASVLGARGKPSTAAYVASKHAVVGLTRSAAIDYAGQGLRINAICPGYTDTPLLRRFDGELRGTMTAAVEETPMGRLGRPEEIADGVLFLAGGRSSYVTGTTLMVDGGYTAK